MEVNTATIYADAKNDCIIANNFFVLVALMPCFCYTRLFKPTTQQPISLATEERDYFWK